MVKMGAVCSVGGNLCETCKTNCRDRNMYKKEGIRVRECEFYTSEEHKYTTGHCKHCGGPRLVSEVVDNKAVEYDSCLGYLPGVKSACCGHGGVAYILFNNDVMIRFTGKMTVIKDYEATQNELNRKEMAKL